MNNAGKVSTRENSDKLRDEAYYLIRQAFDIPKYFMNKSLNRLVDCIIGSAALLVEARQEEAAEKSAEKMSASVDVNTILLQEAAKVGDFILQYKAVDNTWLFQYLDLMQNGEYFSANSPQEVVIFAVTRGNDTDWLNKKIPMRGLRLPSKRINYSNCTCHYVKGKRVSDYPDCPEHNPQKNRLRNVGLSR